jgi:co-chaperonin GroES (HSP10)
MALSPLGHRILIKPDEQAEHSDSGLVLPQDRHHVPVSGTVVAVGTGPARDQKIRALIISRCIGIVNALAEIHDSASERDYGLDLRAELYRYKNQVESFERAVNVGDRVVYPAELGLAITEDGQGYILLNEDDVAVIATDEEAAA